MDDIIKAISSALEVEKKVEYYFTMPDDEKRLLLEGLRKKKTEDIGLFLNAIYLEENNKQIQKMIRRLIFGLKSSGVKVEEPRPAGGPVLKKIEEVRDNRGFITNFDRAQSRTVMAAYEIKKNTFVFLSGEVHFREGLRELMSAPVDRRRLDEIIASYRNSTGEPVFMTEISPAYAAFIVEEGASRSGRFTDGIAPLKSFVTHLKDPVHKPEDIYSLPVADPEGPASMEEILGHPIFTPFSLDWEKIGEDRKEYSRESGATIVLPQHMVEEKRTAFTAALAGRVDISSQAPLVRRMLEDYAYAFHVMGDFARYLGTITLIRDSKALADIITHFLRRSLDAAEEKPAESGLIVNPYG